MHEYLLRELAAQSPKDYIMLVADNAAWHHSSSLIAQENIDIFPLLPYTPELNPIEKIWDELREKGFRNTIFQTLSAVADQLCDTLTTLMQDKERVRSITHRQYLMNVLLKWN